MHARTHTYIHTSIEDTGRGLRAPRAAHTRVHFQSPAPDRLPAGVWGHFSAQDCHTDPWARPGPPTEAPGAAQGRPQKPLEPPGIAHRGPWSHPGPPTEAPRATRNARRGPTRFPGPPTEAPGSAQDNQQRPQKMLRIAHRSPWGFPGRPTEAPGALLDLSPKPPRAKAPGQPSTANIGPQ